MSHKAFDLIPVSDTLKTSEGKSVLISSIDMCGSNLFVGSIEGLVSRYNTVDHDVGSDTALPTVDKLVSSYQVANNKAIIQLRALSAINRLVALSAEGTLTVHDMWHLEPTKDRLRGLTVVCLNHNPVLSSEALSAHICVAKRRQIQLYKLTEERLIHHKDFSARDNPLALAMDGTTVCYATQSHYIVFDIVTGISIEVTAYSSELSVPIIKQIQGCEFLVTGPSNLGIFISGDGNATRPPVPFSSSINSCTYHHPYVLCLNEDTITVYSIFDQEPKQQIVFPGGGCLDNFEGKLMLCTQDIMFTLSPVPWDKQVTELLKQKKVSEALELAKYANKTCLSQEEQRDVISQVKQQAGFIQLSELNFSEATTLLEEGHADARAVISLFSVVSSERYFLKDPFNTPKMEDACGSNSEMRKNAYQWLTGYLERNRYTVPDEQRQAVDSTLLMLYALRSQAAEDSDILTAKLLDMIEDRELICDIDECGTFLSEKLKKHHYKALLYYSQGLHSRGLEIWERLVEGELSDATIDNYPIFLVDVLKRDRDPTLVCQYSKCILSLNEAVGVRVFVERSERLNPDTVLETLSKFPSATLQYLEHLVDVERTKESKHHTQLAMIYLNNVVDLNKNGKIPSGVDYRQKLQTLLRTSKFYRPEKLLDQCLTNRLHLERAILLEKLERHQEAIKVLVYDVVDFEAAKSYCHRISTERLDHALTCRLYGTLLQILMSPANCDNKEEYLEAAVSLLNDDDSEFNMDEVLRLVPMEWQVTSLIEFINKGLRNTFHRQGMLQIRKALTKLENIKTHSKRIRLESTHFLVRESKICPACDRPLLTPIFTRYPDGSIVHIHCARSSRYLHVA